jgi:hypothetical protein
MAKVTMASCHLTNISGKPRRICQKPGIAADESQMTFEDGLSYLAGTSSEKAMWHPCHIPLVNRVRLCAFAAISGMRGVKPIKYHNLIGELIMEERSGSAG